MSRGKKKHVCSCGEEFNHGIGLRKHQRQTGHKGSSVVEDDGSAGEAPAAAPPPPPPAAAAPPPPLPQPEPAPPPPPPAAAPPPPPAVAAAPPPPAPPPARAATPAPTPAAYDDEDDDDPPQTVAVRGVGYPSAPSHPQHVEFQRGAPSRFEHNRQKLSLVGRGLKILLSYRARSAGEQLKASAQSSADIFTEASKIALALLLILAIPATAFWWWWQSRQAAPPSAKVANSFHLDEGATAARATVLLYLDALAKERPEEAYSRLSRGWKSELSQQSFRQSLEGISEVRWAVNDQRLLSEGLAEVSLVLAFVEDGQSKKFRGRFRLTQEDETWKVDRLDLAAESG